MSSRGRSAQNTERGLTGPPGELHRVVLEMVGRGTSLENALDHLCRVIESRLDGVHCAASLLHRVDGSLRLAAAPSLPSELREALITVYPEDGSGTCTRAVREDRPVLSSDALTDPVWSAFRAEIGSARIVASCSAAVYGLNLHDRFEDGARSRPLGTVALYFLDGPRVTDVHLQALELAAAVAGSAIQAAASRALIQRHRGYDVLTGLPNRRLFTRELERGLAHASPRHSRFAVLLLDLDHFKELNETVGFVAGDAVLRAVALRLVELRGPTDVVARLGDDDFAYLLGNYRQDVDVQRVADDLLQALRKPLDFGGHEIFATASLGVSLYPWDGEDAQTLLRNAEKALHAAKQKGRSRVQLYAATLGTADFDTLELKTSLRHSVEEDQLEVLYQPQVECASRTVRGVEALVYWNHPSRGQLSPGKFIDLAEATGMISTIGNWVLREACTRIREWRSRFGNLTVAVNVSALQLQDGAFVQSVAAVLRQTGLPPEALELEITESVAMTEVRHTLRILQELRNLGVQVAIDDFGTGYSSLEYLRRFPIHVLKIDRSFIQGLPVSSEANAIVEAILALGRSLDLSVIAEGVELESQAALLCRNGCSYLQGFLFARPLTAAKMTDYLEGASPGASAE